MLQRSLGLTRTGGTVLVYGMTSEAAVWPVSPYEIFRRELTIKGSFAQQFSFDRALPALRTGRVRHRRDHDVTSRTLTSTAPPWPASPTAR